MYLNIYPVFKEKNCYSYDLLVTEKTDSIKIKIFNTKEKTTINIYDTDYNLIESETYELNDDNLLKIHLIDKPVYNTCFLLEVISKDEKLLFIIKYEFTDINIVNKFIENEINENYNFINFNSIQNVLEKYDYKNNNQQNEQIINAIYQNMSNNTYKNNIDLYIKNIVNNNNNINSDLKFNKILNSSIYNNLNK